MIGYNVQLTWVLAKWTQLPINALLDNDTLFKYRSTIELIKSNFFGSNDFSVVSGLVKTLVDLFFVIFAPLVIKLRVAKAFSQWGGRHSTFFEKFHYR